MKKVFLIVVFLFLIFVFKGGMNKASYKYSALEIDKQLTRQQYYGDLGKIYKNRFGVFGFTKIYPAIAKFENVFYSGLDNPYIYISLYGILFYWGIRKKV